MKNLVNIEDAIASPLEDFHPVVKAFNKATGEPFEKVIGDGVESRFNGDQKTIKGCYLTFSYPLTPSSDGTLGTGLGVSLVVTPKFRTAARESKLKSIRGKGNGKPEKKLQQRI